MRGAGRENPPSCAIYLSMAEEFTQHPLRSHRTRNILLIIFLALFFVALGFFIGEEFGYDLFTTEGERQQSFAEREAELVAGLDRGQMRTANGRILSVDLEAGTLRFADATLAAIIRSDASTIERTVALDERTIVGRQEVADGPRFRTDREQLRAGQSVLLWFSKNDFDAPNPLAKAIIIQEYAALVQ